MTNLVIDFYDDAPGYYGKVHRAGCRDARDPEPLKTTDPKRAHAEIWPEEDDDTPPALIAPCVKRSEQ